MALYESFTKRSFSISEASKLAQAWKSAHPNVRRAACQKLADGFQVRIEGTRTTFVFYKDGTVKTVNAKAHRPAHLVVDETRKVCGFANGKVIYA